MFGTLGTLLIVLIFAPFFVTSVPCSVGDVHLEALKPQEWVLPQSGGAHNGSLFWWNLGYCNPVAVPSATKSECNNTDGGAGYFQQFNSNSCVADFTHWVGIEKNETGVILRASTGATPRHHERVMNFYIECDPAGAGTEVWSKWSSVLVKVEGSTLQYYISARSRCACPHAEGCDQPPPKENDPTLPETPPSETESLMVHPCAVGDIDLSSLPPKEFVLRQNWTDEHSLDEFVWVVGFCTKVFVPPTGNSPCEFDGGAGLLQQYSSKICQADFNVWNGMEVNPDGKGVVITVEQDDGWRYRRTAHIHVDCYPAGNKGQTEVMMSEVPVHLDPWDNDHVIYTLKFRSKCACPGACPHKDAVNPPLPEHHVKISESMQHSCVIQDINLASLPVLEFVAIEHREGYEEDSYVWLVGWCTPIEMPPLSSVGEADPCDFDGGYGYLQQFQNDMCLTDFNEFVDMTVITGGVQITLRSRHSATHVKTARVQVLCDEDGVAGEVERDFQKVEVTDIDGQHREYILRFRSLCACKTACQVAMASPNPSPSPIPEEVRHGCVVGDIDFRSVPQADIVMTERWHPEALPGRPRHPFMWSVGFCGAAQSIDMSPCPEAAAYVQEHDEDQCWAQFTMWKGMRVEQDGLRLQFEDLPDGEGRIRRLVLIIKCNKDIEDSIAKLVHDTVSIHIVNEKEKSFLDYAIEFESRCACPGLCPLEKLCAVGDIKLGALPTKESELPLSTNDQMYSWVVGWCQKITSGPASEDPCASTPGYVHMFRSGWCIASFSEDFSMFTTPEGIVVSATAPGTPKRVVQVISFCERALNGLHVHTAREAVEVEDEIVGNVPTTYFRIYYKSRCACPGGCSDMMLMLPEEPVLQPAKPHSPIKPSIRPATCVVGDIDISAIPLLEVSLRMEDGPSSIWAIGFCHKVFDPPTGITKCDTEYGAGYAQMFNEVKCQGDFGMDYSLSTSKKGVEISVSSENTVLTIDLRCDQSLQGPKAVVDDPIIKAVPEKPKLQLTMRLRSKCACPHGCQHVAAPEVSTPPALPEPIPEAFAHRAHSCIVTTDSGDVLDLSGLPPTEFTLKQHMDGKPDEEYVFLIGWCLSVLQAPTGTTPCAMESGWGYLQQFHKSECLQDFKEFMTISAIGEGNNAEVVIIYGGKSHDGGITSTAVVKIQCAAEISAIPTHPWAHVVGEEINVTQPQFGNNRRSYAYNFVFRSPCACPGRCSSFHQSVPPPVPSPQVSPLAAVQANLDHERCRVKGRDLRTLKPIELLWPQQFLTGPHSTEEYVWVFGWCNTISDPPTKAGIAADPCSFGEGPGYIQQYREGKCLADFNSKFLVAEEENGVLLSYLDTHILDAQKQAFVHIRCDKSLAPNIVEQDSEKVMVTKASAKEEVYDFRLRSRCACVGGCGPGRGCGPICLSVLSIMVLFFGYFTLGMTYNKFVRNATTFEDLLPNSVFWQRVPGRCMACGASLCGFIFARLCGAEYRRVAAAEDDDIDMFDQDESHDYL